MYFLFNFYVCVYLKRKKYNIFRKDEKIKKKKRNSNLYFLYACSIYLMSYKHIFYIYY